MELHATGTRCVSPGPEDGGGTALSEGMQLVLTVDGVEEAVSMNSQMSVELSGLETGAHVLQARCDRSVIVLLAQTPSRPPSYPPSYPPCHPLPHPPSPSPSTFLMILPSALSPTPVRARAHTQIRTNQHALNAVSTFLMLSDT